MCKMGYAAYMDLDEMTADGEAADSFVNEQKAAHAPSVLVILHSLLQIRASQFRRNARWVTPMLAALSVCNDRAIRSAVKLVYDKHVIPIVLETCSKN
jgi:hypothetical protein